MPAWRNPMRIVSSNELPEGKQPERISNVQTPAAGAIAANAVAPQPTPSRNTTDTAQISSLGSKLSSIPEIRQDRVAEVSAQLKSGNYKVSDQQIADSMLKD